MPDRWTGTVEDRYSRLEQAGKRCDGNSRRCTHSATERYTLQPAREFEPIPDEETVIRQSCSRHRQQFVNNESFVVVGTKVLTSRFPNKPHPHTQF